MHLYFIRVFLILLISTFTNSVLAKPLPPGTGNSVKANIMFMLDKSMSMYSSSSQDGTRSGVTPFVDVVPRGDGEYYTVSVAEGGFGLWKPYENKVSLDPSSFNWNRSDAWSRNKILNLREPLNMEVREVQGDHYLYILQDKSTDNVGGYTLQSIWTKIHYRNKKGNVNEKGAKDAHRYFSDSSGIKNADLAGLKLGKIRDKKGFKAYVFQSKPSMDLYENKILVISKDAWRVIYLSNTNGHINTDTNYKQGDNGVTTRVCSKNQTMNSLFDDAIDIVKEGSKIYVYSKDGSNGLILKQEVDNNLCPTGSLYTQWNKTANFDQACGEGRGQSIAIRNNIIFTTGYYNGKVCKYSQSGSTIRLEKSIGTREAHAPNTVGNSEVYNEKPMGISIGSGNTTEENRIYVASKGRSEVIIFNQSDLSYVDYFGDAGVSLWQGAIDSISNVLQDSAINQQANFGIGYWGPSGKPRFRGFFGSKGNKIDDINPRFNDPYYGETNMKGGYISVGINPKGAQQILENFNDDKVVLDFGTNGQGLRQLIQQYWNYKGGIVNPMIDGLDCQINATIVIGDGRFSPGNTNIYPPIVAKTLFDTKKHLTFTVGYGEVFVNDKDAVADFINIAKAGGTHKESNGVVTERGYFNARTPADLKNVINEIVQTIVAKSYSFSSPSISSNVRNAGELFQGKFQNRQGKEWIGTVIKTDLENDGTALSSQKSWDFSEKIQAPDQRNLWTAIPGNTAVNNFTQSNVNSISNFYNKTGNIIGDYHRKTIGTNNLTNVTRCKNSSGVVDGISDEEIGLIKFVRGEDYFDYDGDCDLTEPRKRVDDNGKVINAYVADFYNSELLVVGAPSASFASEKLNTESYFRQKKNYSVFAKNNANRKNIVYGAANNGILHAIDQETGSEIWGFVPPLVIPKLPQVIAPSLNQTSGGGSTPLFLLDGSPVVHDTYFENPVTGREGWHTLLMIPYGRAGAGFSTIDVTDPNNPLHLYSILNDPISEQILRVDHNANLFQYNYSSSRFNIRNFVEGEKAVINIGSSNACNASGSTSCYQSNVWSLNSGFDTTIDYKIFANGRDVTASTTVANVNGIIKFTFNKSYKFDASGNSKSDSINITQIGSLDSAGAEYDYRFLGETWGSPRVFRMPNNGAGDNDIMDDEYVAVLSGGYGNGAPSIGSNVYVIDWLNGKVKKEIKIEDKSYDASARNDITNSIPSSPIVINADAANSNYSGAIVYVNDLEGKITKINLTNMDETPEYDPTTNTFSTTTKKVNLYDKYVMFDTMASTEFNNRYMFHSMDAGIGVNTKNLWLFGGTGNLMNLDDQQVSKSSVENVMFGVKDYTFPNFGTTSNLQSPDNFLKCKDTTKDNTGANCPDIGDRGWYISLDKQKKVVNEPTLKGNIVYYPLYRPADYFDPLKGNTTPSGTLNKGCGGGSAFICSVDAECGTNNSSNLGNIKQGQQCLYVGTGILSKLVVFGLNLYANISGESTNKDKDDIVVIQAFTEDVQNYRTSWRENY